MLVYPCLSSFCLHFYIFNDMSELHIMWYILSILKQAHVFYNIYIYHIFISIYTYRHRHFMNLYDLSSSQVMSGHICRQFFSRCVKNWLVSPVSNILVAPKPLTAIQQSISTETLKSHCQQVWEVRINHHADIRSLCLDSFDTLNLRYG